MADANLEILKNVIIAFGDSLTSDMSDELMAELLGIDLPKTPKEVYQLRIDFTATVIADLARAILRFAERKGVLKIADKSAFL